MPAEPPDHEPKPKRARRKSPVFVARWEVMEDLAVRRPDTIDRMIERGDIPPPVRRVANNRPLWLRKDWNAWDDRRLPRPARLPVGGDHDG